MGIGSFFSKKNKQDENAAGPAEKKVEQTLPDAKGTQAAPQNADEPPVAQFLEQAILENARKDNAETRAKVYQELLFSDLLLALSGEPPAHSVENNTSELNSQNINVAIMSNQEEVPFAAAFTSAHAARRWRVDGGHYVSVRGQDIFRLLESSPAEVIVVNPGSAPFIVLTKLEFRQLAAGIVPKSTRSPVQIQSEDKPEENTEQSLQISFPSDAFSIEQKHHVTDTLSQNESVEAAAVGAILPPNAPKDTPWIRTIFLRVQGLEATQESVQQFCNVVREKMRAEHQSFTEFHFEVGVMPDPNFWVAMHQNNFILFDKNPSEYLKQNS